MTHYILALTRGALRRDLVILPRLGRDPLLGAATVLANIAGEYAAIDTRTTKRVRIFTVRNDIHESHATPSRSDCLPRTKQK